MIGTTPFATDVDIKGENEYVNVFATDTFSVFPWVYVNAAAGWNQANVKLHDRIGTALNGDHSFDRLNPSAGLASA